MFTDHKPNTFLDSKSAVQLFSRQVRWQQFLSRFDFEWEYRKGCHIVADPISRNPALYAVLAQLHAIAIQAKDSEGRVASISVVSDEDMDIYDSLDVSSHFPQRVRDGYAAHPWLSVAADTAELSHVGGYWRAGELIVIPDVSDLHQQCLSLHHNTPYAGHLGRDRTKRLDMQTCWWPSVDCDVRHFVSTCNHC